MRTTLSVFFLSMVFFLHAQQSFIQTQRTFPRVANAYKLKEDTLKKQVLQAGLKWPVQQLYIRSFKYDSQLEVWARNSTKENFILLKSYKVCALSGAMGPKRMEGDYQVPEGFYYINEFNPKSIYHLSLGLNYPNASDQFLSDSIQPGGDIYIHGSCITVGCIPIQNNQIEELYILASQAKESGQDFIPVHVFPVKYNNVKSNEYLQKVVKEDKGYEKFVNKIKQVFDFFEQHKSLPIIAVNQKGEYVVM